MSLYRRSRYVVSRLVKRVMGTRKPKFEIYSDDVFLCSFPRSGNTWTRMMLAHYLEPDGDWDVRSCHAIVPDVGINLRGVMASVPRPRIIKSHYLPINDYPRIVYLVRDGRDVCASYFDYYAKINGYKSGFESFVTDLCEGKLFPSSWHEHVNQWLKMRDHKPFLLIRYEDLLQDPANYLMQILEFAGHKVDHDKVEFAIGKSSLNRIWKQEQSVPENKAVNFTGGVSGTSGKWRELFSHSLNDFFLSVAGEAMVLCGYHD